MFHEAPNGVKFDTRQQIAGVVAKIKLMAVDTNAMPLGNKTGMTESERKLIAATGSRKERRLTGAHRHYPRDMVGYGGDWPDPRWPGDARIAVQFVINFEEGGENDILHGDAASEAFLSDIVNAVPLLGVRHINMESHYEYGSRVGWWRLRRLFVERNMPVTVFAVGMALARVPEIAKSMVEADFEIASHGWRWIDYQYVDPRSSARILTWRSRRSNAFRA